MPTPVKLPAVVVEAIDHAPDLRSFVLAPERPAPRFRPGQFLHLALDPYDPAAHWPESRVFSIASSPDERERLRLTVSRQGSFTTRIVAELQPGARVWIKMPFGSFSPAASPERPVVLLAGGTGITPFISFILWAAARRPAGMVQVHYAARRPELLIYREALEACGRDWRALAVTCYAEELGGGAPGSLRPGRIAIGKVWSGLEAPRTACFYLSGPPGMVASGRQTLLDLGADPEAVIVDEWG